MSKQRIDIIGGGISGLATAYYLAIERNDVDIHVWERDPSPGGLAGTFYASEFWVEKFYHHIYRSDVALQELLKELHLGGSLEWRPAITGSYYAQKSFRLSTPLDLLRYSPLPLLDRLRLAKMVLESRAVKNWEALDDITAREYVTSAAGERVYRLFWEPLLISKFGKHAEKVSAAWLWSKLVDRGSSRDRSGQEVLGYVRGGLGQMFEKLVQKIQERGHRFHVGQKVLRLEGTAERINEIHTDVGTFRPEIVIAAAQLPDLCSLFSETYRSFRTKLEEIEFLANVCLVLTLRSPLSSFYWTNVKDTGAPFVGVIEHSNWVDAQDVGQQHLAYISAYVSKEDQRLQMNADQLLDQYLPWLQKMFPSFSRSTILHAWPWRADYAQPVVTVGYRKRIPSIVTPISNLFLCTMAQIFPHDRQVSNGVEMAKKTVSAVTERLR